MGLRGFVYTKLFSPPPLRWLVNKIILSSLPSKVKLGSAIIYLNPLDPVVSGALTFGGYEKDEIRFFVENFVTGMCFVDIGANVGLYTALALAQSSSARILCIEPDDESRAYLQKTIHGNASSQHQVVIRTEAASDSHQDLYLYKNTANKGDNRIYRDPLCEYQVKIKSQLLDAIVAEEGFEEINFVKIDVQGAEYKAIYGFKESLLKSSNCILMSEFWPCGLRQCGNSPESYLSLLENLGFSLFTLQGKNLVRIQSHKELIARYPGKLYANIIGLKGIYLGSWIAATDGE